MRRLARGLCALLLLLMVAGCDANGPTSFLHSLPSLPSLPLRSSDDGAIRLYARTREGDTVTTQFGTTFLVRHQGKVMALTAGHVVDDPYASLEFDYRQLTVTTVQRMPEDAAVLSLRNLPSDVPILEVDLRPVVRGDRLKAVGYPRGGERATAEGSCLREGVMTCAIEVGMSGGPVLRNGKVVGVISCLYPNLGISAFVPIASILPNLHRGQIVRRPGSALPPDAQPAMEVVVRPPWRPLQPDLVLEDP